MEMSAQGRHELDEVEASIESALRSLCHLRRRRNFLASPLLRLPTELVLNIFERAIEPGDDKDDDDDGLLLSVYFCSSLSPDARPTLFVVTAICHQLREIGIASPQLWSTVDLTTPPIATLFLERCKYDPRILIKSPSPSERRSIYTVKNPAMEVVWEQLEGHTFSNLRSIVFEGIPDEFTRRITDVLRRAPGVSSLDLYNPWADSSVELPWPPGDPIPNLTTLRLRNYLISWTSPFLRNLRQLTLEAVPPYLPSENTPIEMFLTALVNCPNLEVLKLAHAGPDLPNSHQGNCDTVVQLHRLRELFLKFHDPSRVGYILSHIKYPEPMDLTVHVAFNGNADLPEAISKTFPHRNIETIQRPRKSIALTVCLDYELAFSTDNLLVQLQNSDMLQDVEPQVLARFASKVVEVVGCTAIVSLVIEWQNVDLAEEIWEAFLHGLPRLERICYDLQLEKEDDPVDPFLLVFSRPFDGEPVCPWLQHLELPWEVLTQDSSVGILGRALTERDACGRRLKRLGLSGDTTEGDELVLEQFRDLVDEVQ